MKVSYRISHRIFDMKEWQNPKLREADAGPRSGASTDNLGEVYKQMHGRPALLFTYTLWPLDYPIWYKSWVLGCIHCNCKVTQTWFKCSVQNVRNVRFPHRDERQIFETCRVDRKSVNNAELICNICRTAIVKTIIPKLLTHNKLHFKHNQLN